MENPFENFEKNYNDIRKIYDIHGDLTQGIKGKGRDKTAVLLKSSVVLICSCIETFFEDIAEWGGVNYVANDLKVDALSKEMKKKICSSVTKENKDELAPLLLCGEGWKKIYIDIVKQEGRRLNTPNFKNVKYLMNVCFGIEDISDCWCWQGMNKAGAASKLDAIVRQRGDIAHGRSVSGINKNTVDTYANFAWYMAEKTFAEVSSHIGID